MHLFPSLLTSIVLVVALFTCSMGSQMPDKAAFLKIPSVTELTMKLLFIWISGGLPPSNFQRLMILLEFMLPDNVQI